MNRFNSSRLALLAAVTILIFSTGSSLSAQGEASEEKRSIIRVISHSDGDEVENSFFYRGQGDGHSANSWVSSLPLQRGYLGVQLLDLTPELRAHFGVPENAGVMIAKIVADSPAAEAGLRVGDILTAIEDAPMTTGFDVARKVSEYAEGDTITLETWRAGKLLSLTSSVAERERTTLDVGSFVFPGTRVEKRVLLEPGQMPEHVFEIDEGRLNDALREFEMRFEDPKYIEEFKTLGRDREDLQARIQELEKRLKDMEKQLERLSKE